MALWFDIKVNKETIGFFVAQRQSRITDNKICTYSIDIEHNGRSYQYEIDHDYDAGALALIHKALATHLGLPS